MIYIVNYIVRETLNFPETVWEWEWKWVGMGIAIMGK